MSYEEMRQNSLRRKFVSGEKLPYLGRQYCLKVIKTNDSLIASFRFHKGKFLAELHEDIPKSNHRDIISPMYIKQIMEKR